MKYLAFLVFSLLLLFESCCGDGGDYMSSYRTTYARKVKLTDTSDRILKISYKNSDKIFYPNDTIAELIISDNSENTLYIETKKGLDTIALRVEVSYKYYDNECSSNVLEKVTDYTPKIVNHTFQKANFTYKSNNYPYNYYSNEEFDILNITP